MVRIAIVPHLRPTGKPRCDEVAGVVVRNAGAVLSRKRRKLGPRTDERKISFKDIPQLRKFIDAQYPQPVAHARDLKLGLSTASIIAFIIAGMITVAFIMLTFVVPKLLELYQDFGAQLPLSTRILLFISNFFTKFWFILIIIFVVGITLLLKYLKTTNGKIYFDSFLLRLPVVGNVIKMAALVDATRTLSILVSSGVSLLEGLNIVVNTSSNIVYKRAFEKITKQVEKGISLGTAMKQIEIFPPILVQMTLVGEQTGHLDETLFRVSRYFENDSELAIKAMTTLIEPTILVILGVGVGFLVFAVITPIYTIK